MDNEDMNWFCYILGPELEEKAENENPENILISFCKNNNTSIEALLSSFRFRELVAIRQTFCKWALENTTLSTTKIGNIINRDHSTVIHSYKTANNRIVTNDRFFKMIYSRCMLAL